MGADYGEYINEFTKIGLTGQGYMEEGYVLLNRIIYAISSSHVALAVGVNLLFFLPFYFFLKKTVKKENWFFCVFVFSANPYMYIQTTFNAMRQCCATGIILIAATVIYSTSLLKFKKFLFSTLLVLLAAQFHKISYIFLLFPLFMVLKFKKKTWYIISTMFLLMSFLKFSALLDLVANSLGFGKYVNYEASFLNNPIYVVFVYAVILLLIKYSERMKDNTSVNVYLFSLSFLLFAVTNDMVYRVYMMLSLVALPGLANILHSDKEILGAVEVKHNYAWLRSGYIMYYLAFYVGYIMYLAIKNNSHYIPFNFYFQ